jgi:hypothetical protein
MTSDKTEPVTQRTDGDTTPDDDTEGHSMLNAELARTIGQDRARETDKLVRDGARVRDARTKSEGGFLKRFGRR